MRYIFILLIFASLALPAWCQLKKAEALPTIACARIDRDITLTGKLDDPLWQQAKAVTLLGAYDSAKPRFKTTARMLYNDRYLYVGYTCEDTYIWGTYTQQDDPLYMEEVVEIFISPTGNLRNYYEIEVSPLNTFTDSVVLNGRPRENTSWSNFHNLFAYNMEGLLTKTFVDGALNTPGAGRSWSVEIAIPFSALIGPEPVAPKAGTKWRVNLFRVDVPEKDQVEFYAWSTIKDKSDLHRPWYFGYLQFDGKKK